MKRRAAIRNIAIGTATLPFLPYCNVEPEKIYENLPLDKPQKSFVKVMAEQILPTKNSPIQTPETTADFILTVLNNCYPPEDIQRYCEGLAAFQIDWNTHKQLPTDLPKGEPTKAIDYFLTTTRSLATEHLTTSEHFLTNYLDYQFVPGGYDGCAAT